MMSSTMGFLRGKMLVCGRSHFDQFIPNWYTLYMFSYYRLDVGARKKMDKLDQTCFGVETRTRGK